MDNNKFKIKDVFGINVFDDNVMSDMLPKSISVQILIKKEWMKEKKSFSKLERRK